MCLAEPTPLLAKEVPDLNDDEWKKIDDELRELQGLLHHLLATDEIPSDVAMDKYTVLLTSFLSSKPEFQGKEKTFFAHAQPTTIQEARKMKKILGKKIKQRGATDEDRRNFHQAQRALSFLIRKDKEKKEKSATFKQESSYRKNFFKFAKAACNGTLDKEEAGPTFSKEDADAHYKGTYSKAVNIDSAKLDWFPEVEPPTVPYNSSPITPKEVRDIIRGKSPTTAPGEDGLLYGVLGKLPSVHHFLATHYNKTDARAA